MKSLVRLWLRLVSAFVPRDERARWREEWQADIDAVDAAGATLGRIIRMVAGMAFAGMTFRIQGTTMDGWLKEIMFAVRGLLRRPAFTAIAVLTLGFGIGANSAIFSLVNGVVLEPLRYPDSGELVKITSSFPTMGFEDFWISPPEYMQISENVRSFESVGAYTTGRSSVGADTRPERVNTAFVTHQLFEVLAVPPALGRYLSSEDDVPGAPSTAVLSHEMWQRSFGGDPDIVGREIDVNGISTTVVGVMREGFDVDDAKIELWRPLQLDWTIRSNFGSHYLFLVARVAPGISVEAAAADLQGFVQRFPQVIAEGHVDPETHPLHLIELQEDVIGDVRPALLVLLGAVGFVLLIACANVASLLLARAEDRHKEVAVRVAMGAGKGRLLRQFLTEGMVLSVVGAVVGVGLAAFSLRVLQAAGPGDLPRLSEVSLDGTVLLFTMIIGVATGIFFGLAPARHVSSGALAMSLREGGTRTTASIRQGRLRTTLVATEIALALILAVGAGLMIRSLGALTAVEPGFDPDGLLTFQLFLPNANYPDVTSQEEFYTRLTELLAAEPGVTSIAAMSGLPPVRPLNANDTEFEGIPQTQDGPPQNVDFYQTISTDYLETMGIRVVEGRGFEASDDASAVPVTLVNQALVERFYPGESPIGRRIRPSNRSSFLEIVGVVADVKQAGLDEPVGTEMYFHYPQSVALGNAPSTMNFVVATSGDPSSLVPQVRQAVWGLDAALPVSGMQTMNEVLGDALSRARFITSLLATFAALALALAAVGTYGVMSYTVARRSRELGIRMAMGAEASAVRALVVGQGLKVALVGLAGGLGGAWLLTGIMESMLFNVAVRDPVTFLLAPPLLILVAAAASWLPALRATRVNPITVLREE